MRQVKEED